MSDVTTNEAATPADGDMSEAEYRAEVVRHLQEYQSRQTRQRMIGPAASLGMHLLIVVLLQVMIVGEVKEQATQVEVQMVEMEIKELEDEVLEELVQEYDDPVETVEMPELVVEVESQPTDATSYVEDVAVSTVSELLENSMPQQRDFGAASDYSDALFMLDSAETALKMESPSGPLGLPSALSGRVTEASRAAGRARFGGSDATEGAVIAALRWLRDHQNPDGSWSQTKPQAMTALGLLAFMAHGEGFDSPEFGDTVRRASQRLYEDMMSISESNPPLDEYYPYRNGMMTYALAEAYAITRIPKMKVAMEKGLRVIVTRQQPGGGWDYAYTQGARWDITASTWQMQALKAGYTAGSDTPGVAQALDRGAQFLRDTAWKDGRFQWVPLYPGDWGVQGCGVLCLQITGYGRSRQARAIIDEIYEHGLDQFDAIRKDLFWEHNNPYYDWYYETQVMFHAGNKTWRRWNRGFSAALMETQQADGHWDIPGERSQRAEHAPYQTTMLNCLSLQIYYRYLPSYQASTVIDRPGSGSHMDDMQNQSDLNIEGTHNR